jgi:integrase
VFSGAAAARPLGNMVMLILLGRMGRCDLTAHDFRSTFSDWCAERTNTPSEVREMALAHAVGKVEAAYRRGDLFREAAPTRRGIGRLLHVEPRGAVIPLRAAQ